MERSFFGSILSTMILEWPLRVVAVGVVASLLLEGVEGTGLTLALPDFRRLEADDAFLGAIVPKI